MCLKTAVCLFIAVLIAIFCGCSGTGIASMGVNDDDEVDAGENADVANCQWVFDPSGGAYATYHEEVWINARCVDSEGVAAKGDVYFGLVGDVADSTVYPLNDRTNSSGWATTKLTSGSRNAQFQIQAYMDSSSVGYLSVTVSKGQGGTINVWISSQIEDVTLMARAYGIHKCDSMEPWYLPGDYDSEKEADKQDQTLIEIEGLDLDGEYALAVTALSDSGAVKGYACRDGIEFSGDTVIDVSLKLNRVPVDMTGVYDSSIMLEASLTGMDTFINRISDSMKKFSGENAQGQETANDVLSSEILDGIEKYIQDTQTIEAAMLFATHRSNLDLDDVLSADLDNRNVKADSLADDTGKSIRDALKGIYLKGEIDIGDFHFDLFSVADAQMSIVEVISMNDPATPWLVSISDVNFELTDRDIVTGMVAVDFFGMGLKLGEYIQHVLENDVWPDGADNITDLLAGEIDCAGVSAALSGFSEVTSICNSACLELACTSAVSLVSEGFEEEMDTISGTYTSLQFSGMTLGIVESDDEPYAEALAGDAGLGEWKGAGSLPTLEFTSGWTLNRKETF